jgi:hypothetical protein
MPTIVLHGDRFLLPVRTDMVVLSGMAVLIEQTVG